MGLRLTFFRMDFCPRLRRALLVLVLAGNFGCSGEAPDEGAILEPSTPLYFEAIGYGDRASLNDTTEIVIRDEDTWRAYADSLNPIAPFDTVDFSQAVVLLAALPQEASCYSVEFVSIEEGDTSAVAEYLVEIPDTDCLTAYANVVPFQAVLVRKTEKPFHFQRTTASYRCTFGRRK